MRNRKSALIAGVCTMVSVFWLAGCGPKEIENEYVKINRYTGLEVNEITESKVTDETVDSQMEQIRGNYATYKEITDRPAQKGDRVTIDYSGKVMGLPLMGVRHPHSNWN